MWHDGVLVIARVGSWGETNGLFQKAGRSAGVSERIGG